jgi:MoaA/NifB/PqqE/SkfB family radical SAM enzyme
MGQLRKALYNGEKHPWCQRCWDSQNIGQQSQRQNYNRSLVDAEVRRLVLDSVANNYHVDGQLRFLDLKLGNLCNLKCVMCHPTSSSKIRSEWLMHQEWFPEVKETINIDFTWPEQQEFREQYLPFMRQMKYIKFTGGEPMINPYIDEILSLLPDDCTVHIVTNLTILDDRKIRELKRFKNLWLIASVDAVGDLYEIIRFPGKWPTVKQNILKVQEELPAATFGFGVTVSALSILRIDETVNQLTTVNSNVNLTEVSNPNYMALSAVSEDYMPEIWKRVQCVQDSSLKNQLTNMLDKRIFNNENFEAYNTYLKKISSIRNLKIDQEKLLTE